MEWLWLVLLGFGTGAYGVVVGAGGGFILGPALLIFFDIEPKVVAGTVLALVAINTISGSQVYRRMGLVDRRSGFLFAAAAIPGSVLGPLAVSSVAPDVFRVLFGVLLVALAVQIAVQGQKKLQDNESKPARRRITFSVRSREIRAEDGQVHRYEFNEMFATAFNFVLGFISSFFGTGGGFLRVPVLVSSFGFPVHIAVATSIFTMSFYTTAGAITHISLGHIEWFPTFVWAGIGLVTGAQVGARLTHLVKGPWILRLLLVVVLALGIRLIIEGIQG